MVATPVKLEPVTVDFNVVPVKVPASAVTVISALPSNATPLIFLVAANFVAVAAFPVKAPVTLPVKFPTKLVDVTVLKPAKALVVAPNAIFVEPSVNALLARLLFAIAVPLHTPLVIVPTVVKLANEVNVVFDVAVILPAVVAVVALPFKFPINVGAVILLENVFAPAMV